MAKKKLSPDSFFETPPIDARWVASGLRVRILVPLGIALLVLTLSFVVLLSGARADRSTQEAMRDAKSVVEMYQDRRSSNIQTMRSLIELVMKDPRIETALRARDRKTLLELSAPIMEGIWAKNSVSRFYYILPDQTTLLRVHAPEEFGDKISRYVLGESEHSRPFWGNEVDPSGNFTLQVVYPWKVNGQLLGYIEMGVDFDRVLNGINSTVNADVFIAIDKSLFDVSKWQALQQKNSTPVNWEEFPDTVVMSRTRNVLPTPVQAYLSKPADTRNQESFEGSANGQVTRTTPMTFANRMGQRIGELLVTIDVTEAIAERNQAVSRVVLLIAVIGSVLMAFFYALLGRVQKDVSQRTALLDEARGTLTAEQHERQRAERELTVQHERNELLEARGRMVEELGAANLAATSALKRNEEIAAELRKTQSELMATARQAGRAEIATNVLHNVGNVLNSVNVSAGVMANALRQSRLPSLERALRLMDEHPDDLADYLTHDEKGRMLPAYLGAVTKALMQEHAGVADELTRLNKNIEHIKEIVTAQQSHAGGMSVIEPVSACDLAEDALRLQGSALARHQVSVIREFEAVPTVPLDRARVLQILVNLISNAKSAMSALADSTHRLTLRVELAGPSRLRFSVRDEGEGIDPGNLTRIFAHGFTTRKTGHGFGLHSSALAATEMGGTLTASSDGPGKGATFILELPFEPPQATA